MAQYEDERAQRRGMSRREAGQKGGRIAHERGTAHEWTPEEAREAGRLGGLARARNRQLQLQQQTMPQRQTQEQRAEEMPVTLAA